MSVGLAKMLAEYDEDVRSVTEDVKMVFDDKPSEEDSSQSMQS